MFQRRTKFLAPILLLISITLPNLSLGDLLTYDGCHPNQVHLNIGNYYHDFLHQNGVSSTSAIPSPLASVMWQTRDNCTGTYLKINPTGFPSVAHTLYPRSYKYSGIVQDVYTKIACEYNSTSYIVELNSLTIEKSYTYMVYSPDGTSSAGPYTFKLPRTSGKENTFVVIADSDVYDRGIVTLNAIERLLEKNWSQITGIINLGDIAYNLQDKCGLEGENYLNHYQNVHSNWPVMLTLGNHEVFNMSWDLINFRWQNLGYDQSQNHYYSYNIGYAHFISVDLYYHYLTTNSSKQLMRQWVINDLDMATKPENRKNWPWIIILQHYPIYCSNTEYYDCSVFYERYREWDELWYKYKVDLAFCGHVHYYERMAPIYNNKIANSLFEKNETIHEYVNANATVYILDGSAGTRSRTDVLKTRAPYSQFGSNEISYGVLNVYNNTTLGYTQYLSDSDNILDYMYLKKTNLTFEQNAIAAATVVIKQDNQDDGSILPYILILALLYYLSQRKKETDRNTSKGVTRPEYINLEDQRQESLLK